LHGKQPWQIVALVGALVASPLLRPMNGRTLDREKTCHENTGLPGNYLPLMSYRNEAY
jgi:hypothetical protein